MQTFIAKDLIDTPEGKEANRILRSCVHCGFCTATCPTYQLLGDELDGPRGRIYLIKSLLEGKQATRKTQFHLDRCLTCRACETICPSGVEYGRLLDIGRQQIEAKVPRSFMDRVKRLVILKTLPYRPRISALVFCGRLLRPLMPARYKKLFSKPDLVKKPRTLNHGRRVILFRGCVQSSLTPQTNRATARLLDKLGITVIETENEGCCGALPHHLGQPATQFIKNNIDAWWPYIEEGVEAIINTASGCGVMLKDYAYLLRNDPAYARKAQKVSEMTGDISELFTSGETDKLVGMINNSTLRIAFQCPCTLQHGQKLKGRTEEILTGLGFKLCHVRDSVLCCGSAGTYSIFQPELSSTLREKKIRNLLAEKPDVILTANIGCQLHLQQSTEVPVKHWIEFLNDVI